MSVTKDVSFKDWKRDLRAYLLECGVTSLSADAWDEARQAWLDGASPADFYATLRSERDEGQYDETLDVRELGLR